MIGEWKLLDYTLQREGEWIMRLIELFSREATAINVVAADKNV